MNVLEIITSTEIGGAPKHLIDLMSGLSKKEKIILYLASPNDPPFYDKLNKLSHNHFLLKKNTFDFFAFIRLLYFVKKHNIHLIHSHGRGAGIYSRLLFLFGIKVIHTFHGIHAEASILGRIKTFADKILSPFANHYIFVSEDERERGHKLGLCSKARSSSVILNGINLEKFPFIQKKISNKNHLIFGTFTRPDYAKAPDLLLGHFEKLTQEQLPFTWELNLAGRDLEMIQVPNSLKDKIKIIGEVSNTVEFYQKIDLYVSSSRWEGMPLSILEAMSCGTPCLISNVSGHFYFSKNNVAMSFALDDFNSFLAEIKKIHSRPHLTNEARSFIEKNHALIQMCENVFNLYLTLNKQSA